MRHPPTPSALMPATGTPTADTSDQSPSDCRRRSIAQVLALTALLPHWKPAASAAASHGADALWRVVSRVGYAPTPLLLQQVGGARDAQDWALAQIDAAYAAAQRPPALPPELAGIDAPLPALFAGARREREERRERKAQADENAAPRDGRTDFLNDPDPLRFGQNMTRQAAAWRVLAASEPGWEPPLLARMTEFWFNHLNVYAGKGLVRPFVGHYAIHVARTHALGRFEDLLLASARHPAMLFYLDQYQSVAEGTPRPGGGTRGLNENYARELMELHTLGADAGYSQADVRELARILTGWTVAPEAAGGFRFAPRLHDSGRKRLLGQEFPRGPFAGGEREGEDAIRMLARQPATARRIGKRLAQYFVADDPSPSLVRSLSEVFLATQGDLRRVLRTLFESADFWDPGNRLFKTPMDFALSALTVVQATTDDALLSSSQLRRALVVLGYLNNVGQPMHGWQTPDGYAFDAATWMVPEALTRRADCALALAQRTQEPSFLRAYLAPQTLQAIDRQPAPMRAGLMLASAEFMRK